MLTASDITKVLAEISPLLRGGWIQKIQQPTDRTVVLDVRVPGQTHRLLISCRPDTARVHLTTHAPVNPPTPPPFCQFLRAHFQGARIDDIRQIEHDRIVNPPTPPPFCQFLRAHFQGARIDDIRQIEHDRIVELQLTGKEGAHSLVCELTGNKANLLILDAERRVLRDLTRQYTRTGQAYTPPPQRNAAHDTVPSRFAHTGGGVRPVSEAIDAHYRQQEATQTNDRIKDERLRVLKKTLKKEQRLIEAWRNDLAKSTAYRDYAWYGELIKANLSTIMKGADHIEMTDYFDERLPTITIPLNPIKSAQGNMDDYFRKHRKYLAAERELKPRIERAEQGLEKLRQELTHIEQGNWTPPSVPPARLNTTIRKEHRAAEQRRGPFRRFTRRFTSTDGLPIFIGRNARENDELTFGLAKSDDLWLHARGTPGSHVVVRLGKGTDPPPETLRDAAMLALLYSDLKKSGKGEVIYTRRKWVKKAKGQAPGAVIVTQEKSLHVSLDKTRLDALKTRGTSEQ
ncbi:MAG: fibronectin-binding domain-containing protein [Nitrospira sp.]|nr:fibronectin-binding domain-containing protein [Nitrospira sp.]